MYTKKKEITEKVAQVHEQIKPILMEEFKHLYFFISCTGDLSCWVRTLEGKDGAGIHLQYKINVGQLLCHEWDYLHQLNLEVELAHTHPESFFYCTECGQVKDRKHYAHSVFAGVYCDECAEKPDIANLIKESQKRGFYD